MSLRVKKSQRIDARNTLSFYFDDQKDVLKIEGLVFKKMGNDLEKYRLVIYQCVGYASSLKVDEIIRDIEEGCILWNQRCYNDTMSRLRERNEFLKVPFEVEEGVLQCKKCNSKKTYSYQKQVRSSDEAMSTYSQCMNCNSRWVYSG